MNRIGRFVVLLVVLPMGFTAGAVTSENSYGTIVDRNIFRLTNPPPPPVEPVKDELLERNIELSGITSIDGQKKAWFILKPKGAKESLYVELGENQEKDALKVVSISEEAGEVKVVNSGNSMVLSFKNNAPKALPVSLPGAPVAGAIPGRITAPPIPNYSNPSAATGGRSSVTVAGGTPQLPTTQFSQTAVDPATGLRQIPTRQVRVTPNQEPAPQAEPVDPVRQRQLMEIQQEVFNAAGVDLPPLPPLNGNGGVPSPPGLPPTPTQQ